MYNYQEHECHMIIHTIFYYEKKKMTKSNSNYFNKRPKDKTTGNND